MKFYTKKDVNIIFTVKKDSDLTGLIPVPNIADGLESKNLAWVDQAKSDSEKWATVLDIATNCTDSRIDRIIDICHVDNLSDECGECISIF